MRAAGGRGCALSGVSPERLLIVVNKAASSQTVVLPAKGTALAGCSRYEPSAATMGAAPQIANGEVRIVEPAESMSVYAVR